MEGNQIPLLPTEILYQICAFMPLSDLKSTRMASKLLESCASSLLFKIIYIDILPESFDKLLAIAAHPKFALGVRSVYFESRVFRSRWNMERFKEEYRYSLETNRDHKLLDESFPRIAPRPEDISDEKWSKYYASHISICKSQRQLLANSIIDSVLLQAFQHFPKLENIFMGHIRSPPADNDPPLLYSGIMTRTIREVLVPPSYELMTRARHSASVLTAAGNAGIKLRSIHLANVDGRLFYSPLLPYNQPLRASLASMQTLRMHINLIRNPDDAWLQNFDSFTEHCPSLRHLEIFARNEGFMPSRVLRDKNWPNIRTIELQQVALIEDDLVNLVDSHSTTISYLVTKSSPLVLGNWPSVYTRLKKLFSRYDVVTDNGTALYLKQGSRSFLLLHGID
jgi:hypothetical protein